MWGLGRVGIGDWGRVYAMRWDWGLEEGLESNGFGFGLMKGLKLKCSGFGCFRRSTVVGLQGFSGRCGIRVEGRVLSAEGFVLLGLLVCGG